MKRLWYGGGLALCLVGTSIMPNAWAQSLPSSPKMPDLPSADEVRPETDIDDIVDQATQQLTWICRQNSQEVAVEVKEIDDWQSSLNPDKTWQCEQNLPTIPDDSASFSCEPNARMGLITVFWLKGEGGKVQMKDWMQRFANDQNMVCTRAESNTLWN